MNQDIINQYQSLGICEKVYAYGSKIEQIIEGRFK